jgi:O-antigen chain-terminating methyltransferase
MQITSAFAVVDDNQNKLTSSAQSLALKQARMFDQMDHGLQAKANAQETEQALQSKANAQETEQALQSKANAQETEQALQAYAMQLIELSCHLDKKADVAIIDDDVYQTFEDAFRGSTEDIQQRLNVYTDLVTTVFAEPAHSLAIDVGCGRGEWLALLKQMDIHTIGIDINSAMINHCQSQGFEVISVDAVDYLRQQSDNAMSLVTGFHIIEHIAFERLLMLFKEAYRVVKPGGLVIFETPNPTNLLVGAGDFYLDPTHRQPLHPLTMQFFLTNAGFESVEINYVDANGLLSHADANFDCLNDYVNIPRDYAVIGKKACG